MLNKKIRVLIVDDEPLAREAIRILLKEKESVEILPDARNGNEAVKVIVKEKPDIIFLDIQMPDLDGFGVIKKIGAGKMPITIFVTAFDQYALQAFEVHALDYLLKSFNPNRFNEAFDRAEKFLRSDDSELKEKLLGLLQNLQISDNSKNSPTNTIAADQYSDKLMIRNKDRIFFLKSEEIFCVEATGDYATLRTKGKSYMLRERMSQLERRLDPAKFMRIHRSTIINIEFIKEINPLFKGEFMVILTNGKEFKVGRGYQFNLQNLLNRYS